MFLTAAFLLFVTALIVISALALHRGGRDERAATIAFLVALIASQPASLLMPPAAGPQYAVMAIDAALCVAFMAIAARSTRFWPIWATASQLVGTLTHLAAVLRPQLAVEAYATTQPFWAFPILAAIAVGTRSQIDETKRRRLPG